MDREKIYEKSVSANMRV